MDDVVISIISLYLPRSADQQWTKTRRFSSGLIVDFDQQDRPIGVEITSPATVTLDASNDALCQLGQEPATPKDFEPFRAA